MKITRIQYDQLVTSFPAFMKTTWHRVRKEWSIGYVILDVDSNPAVVAQIKRVLRML